MDICICGYGVMGKTITKVLLSESLKDERDRIFIFDPSETAQKEAQETGCEVISKSSEEGLIITTFANTDIFFLCMKPQDILSFIKFYIARAPKLPKSNPYNQVMKYKQLFISIAAGTSLASIKNYFKLAIEEFPYNNGTNSNNPTNEAIKKKLENLLSQLRFARIMPNLASRVGKGAGAVTYEDMEGTEYLEKKNFVKNVLGEMGTYLELDESYMDAVTALSGSAPAFLFVALDTMADAGVKMGLSRQDALTLAAATLSGAGELTLETKENPNVLKDKVASPAGTTIAGLHALEQGKSFREALGAAILAAYKRSRHLAREAKRSLNGSKTNQKH